MQKITVRASQETGPGIPLVELTIGDTLAPLRRTDVLWLIRELALSLDVAASHSKALEAERDAAGG